MRGAEDPIETGSDGTRDLYDIATWTPRTRLDRLAVQVYHGLVRSSRIAVIILAVAILVAQFLLGGLVALEDPIIGAFTLLSVVPALAIALYVWDADVAGGEPLHMLVGTFLLGLLFAGFASILNTIMRPLFGYIPFVGVVLFFFLIVGPIEETVKWLAVRLYAYRSDTFEAVIDGAVYGAMAGLGFATIENTVFIGRQYLTAMQSGAMVGPFGAALQTATARFFAGPGHVLYSAVAGYYLGLAKFNREHAGPIVVKGLLIAVAMHATYNTLVGIAPPLIATFTRLTAPLAFILFVIVYDGILGWWLYRKLARYRTAYHTTDLDEAPPESGEL